MQIDFHYYATYCAAFLAGYTPEEARDISYSDQFVDQCTRTFLTTIKGPLAAATTQLALEMLDARTDVVGLQDITRIWASFHFLPYDLHAEVKKGSANYKNKMRLICNSNGALVADTVEIAKGHGLQAAGLAMHVLADTWAHKYFAGTPSMVINNTDSYFFELLPGENGKEIKKQIIFSHSPSRGDDLEVYEFMASMRRSNENSIMNLGHGRAGHLPDYSFIRYRYLPAWANFKTVDKDNPSDFYHAFCQVVYALKYLRGENPAFETNQYDWDAVAPWEEEIREILCKRQIDSCADWKALGEKMTGTALRDFDVDRYKQEYMDAPKEEKKHTFLGRFFLAAMRQKSMVVYRIFKTGNLLAGVSEEFKEKGFRGMDDFAQLIEDEGEEEQA